MMIETEGMIAIRDCVRTLIEYQAEDYPDADIQAEQEKLNGLYDDFSKKYGMINARANNSAFSSDSSYCLLSSLKVLDDEGNFVRKADMFTKRTIKQKVTVLAVDTASESVERRKGHNRNLKRIPVLPKEVRGFLRLSVKSHIFQTSFYLVK